MDEHDCPAPTTLFTLRVWPEPVGGGRVEWRGRVQHALTRETRYFRSWHMLVGALLDMLGQTDTSARPAASAGTAQHVDSP